MASARRRLAKYSTDLPNTRSASLLAILAMATVAGCANPVGIEPQSDQPQDGPSLATSGVATTYYVSPLGDDNNPGTSSSKPWRTLANVNGRAFAPGEVIAFQGGAVFSGRLAFDASDKGTAASPIRVTSYGTGRATINAGGGDAISLYNTAGFEIVSLNLVGSGNTTNTGSGVNVFADLAGNVTLDYIRIDSLDVREFGNYGVVIGTWNGLTGFSNVRVTNSSSHRNTNAGFMTFAQSPYAHRNVYFGYLRAYNNPGKSGTAGPSGSGIVMSGVTGGTIERSLAWNNGTLCTAASGPVGVWAYDADHVTIQYNESYNNRTGGTADGGGFDLDQNTRYSTIQYNYSHGNDGPGILLAQAPFNVNHTGNTVRYNVSENDGRKNSPGAITVWGKVLAAEIFNNTVYLAPTTTGLPRAVLVHNSGISTNYLNGVHFRNNILDVTGTLRVVEVMAGQLAGAIGLRFEGNSYYSGGLANQVVWGATTYAGVTPWETGTTQEILNGTRLGIEANPLLVNPGSGGTVGNATLLSNMQAYRLASTSPLIDRGLDLSARFGIAAGATDFYAGALPFGVAYDVGAHEWH